MTAPTVSALACAESHPFDDTTLCGVVGPHTLHDPDGENPWRDSPEDSNDSRRTA